MIDASIIGLIAATLTTAAFIPQVIQTWKSRSAKDLSLGLVSMLTFGTLMWLVYGLMINDLPVILANIISFVLNASLFYFKIRYGKN